MVNGWFFEQVKNRCFTFNQLEDHEKRKVQRIEILEILKEQEQGAKVSDIRRKHGISDATFYNLKGKYSGMTVNQLKRLRELEWKKKVSKKAIDASERTGTP